MQPLGITTTVFDFESCFSILLIILSISTNIRMKRWKGTCWTVFFDVKDDCSTVQVPDLEAREVYIVDVVVWWTQILCHTSNQQQLKILVFYFTWHWIRETKNVWDWQECIHAYINTYKYIHSFLKCVTLQMTLLRNVLQCMKRLNINIIIVQNNYNQHLYLFILYLFNYLFN